MSKVYLFGNGFDISLGLKSRYTDYADSSFWPFKPGTQYRMGNFLNEEKDRVGTWFDLEALLGSYAVLASKKITDAQILEDKEAFDILLSSFCEYIRIQQLSTAPNKDSLAAALIRHFSTDETRPSVFTFNYTDLNDLARCITAYNKFEYHHVHGSWKEGFLIMGFGDGTLNVAPEYNFMRKSFNPRFKPPKIISELVNADTVVFFGLSMGDIDYSYYDYFFRKISTPEKLLGTKPKRVIVFAFDDQARMSILDNLYAKTNNQLSNLSALNDFQMVTIKNENEKVILDLINTI